MWRKTLSGTPDTLTMDCRNHLYIAARNSSLLEVARLLGTAEGRELINKDDGSGDVGLLCLASPCIIWNVDTEYFKRVVCCACFCNIIFLYCFDLIKNF